MIQAKELMIGDWVLDKAVSDKPVQVMQINERNVHYKHKKGYTSVGIELLEPVPLTPEILERNGFVTKDKGREHYGYLMYFLYDEEDHCLLGVKWYIKDSIAEITLETTPYYIIIKYVHRLQLVLRLCGLEKEIKLEG
jgi:hypothetical protein